MKLFVCACTIIAEIDAQLPELEDDAAAVGSMIHNIHR